ncbi:DNA-directed RNA polymerase subunit omega [Rubellimicrobium arenae]|uniref:DNA-directed RNA polymerase subunit omega n=1 Tax=Rubellimicrobium arenae TaxID=2817372 RepID=UPI001B304CF5|nr:DNA-directed RNA polymerase subunit omega [Rubellimicrobium arenae]
MNPLIVFDAKKVVPDPFALTLAAAARARALRQGAEPRVIAGAAPGPHLALAEIAAGAFAKGELASFLPDAAGVPRLAPPKPRLAIGDGGRPAVAVSVPAKGTVH